MTILHNLRVREQTGSSELTEFAPVLYITFLLILMPLLDFAIVFVAGATQYLVTNDIVAKAATQADYSVALNTMTTEAYSVADNGLAKFVHMSAEGGYTGSGADLYVLSTDLNTKAVTSSIADQPLSLPIDTTSRVYEFAVTSKFSVSPLVNLAAVPVLGDVPGLGQPISLTFTASRPVEHPNGLQVASNIGNGGGGVTPFNRVASNSATSSGGGAGASSITWRTPDIFSQIKASGQSVVSINVVNVLGNYGPTLGGANGGWQSTGVVVQPGQTVWIDTQAVGLWADTADGMTIDANGFPSIQAGWENYDIDYDLPSWMLIGYVGNPPILPYGHTSGWISGDSRFIPSGNTLLNYPVTSSGPISLANNENQIMCGGSQKVRIIIAQ